MKYFVIGLIIITAVLVFANFIKKVLKEDELSDEWAIAQYLLIFVLLIELILASML